MKNAATGTALALCMGTLTVAVPSFAAESWIACDGTVVTVSGGGAEAQSKPVHDVFVYDDATQRLFKYSDSRKALDTVFVTGYSQREIKWGSPAGASFGDARWEGTLNRAKLALSLVRRERGETMTWTETCKPAQPLIK